jgi:hypothetical protein
MKKRKLLMLITIGLVVPLMGMAQTKYVQITKFERNYTSLKASVTPVIDNAGEECALIRFWYSGSDFIFEPNMGYLKKEENTGETRMWVPKGTKRITIRHNDDMPLRNYSIPMAIESKVTYDAEVVLVEKKPIPKNQVYIGAGYNIMSLSGPSIAIGANLKHHQIELGAVYGLNKSDDLYFYDANDNLKAGYNYNAIRAGLTYGYEIPVSDFFYITPMAGVSYLAYLGSEASSSTNGTDYKNANALSAIGGMRLSVGFGKNFRLCITPEYHAAVYKDKNCKLFTSYDDTMKSWHTGFNLNVGLLVYF